MQTGPSKIETVWREELIKQAEQLLQEVIEIRDLAVHKITAIVGQLPTVPPVPQGTTTIEQVRNDCFSQNMECLLGQIAFIDREIRHELERL